MSAASSRTAAKSSLLPGLAKDDSLSSASLLVGEEDLDLEPLIVLTQCLYECWY